MGTPTRMGGIITSLHNDCRKKVPPKGGTCSLIGCGPEGLRFFFSGSKFLSCPEAEMKGVVS